MPVRDQETTSIGPHRIQDAGIYEEGKRNSRRIVQIKLPDVGNNSEVVRTVHAIDSVNAVAAEIGTNESDEHIRGPAEKRDVDRAAEANCRDCLRKTARERRNLTGARVNARDPSKFAFNNIQCAVRPDSAAQSS